MPPQHIPAEMALLGACMLSEDALDAAIESVDASDFYRMAHAHLFAAMCAMRDEGRPVDPITLADYLGKKILRMGGAPYLFKCTEAIPTAANAAYYGEIIRDKAKARRLVELSQRVSQLAHDADGDPAAVIDRARDEIDRVAEAVAGGSVGVRADVLAERAVERYDVETPPALATGWPDLNRTIAGGLRPGTLTIFGGRPSQGKSLVVGCLALDIALRGHGVLFVSLEMSEAEIIDRMLANLGDVDLGHLVAQTLTDYDVRAVTRGRGRLEGIPLDIIDDQAMTLSKIRSAARAKARTPEGLSLLVVDYLGLLAAADSPKDRNRLVEAVSRGLKVLSRDLAIPIVAAHQLNREGARRRDPRPVLTDFRDSGSVEQDADVACLLYRPEGDVADGVDPNELEVIVAKNRQGPKKVIRLHFNGVKARVGSMAKFDLIRGGE